MDQNDRASLSAKGKVDGNGAQGELKAGGPPPPPPWVFAVVLVILLTVVAIFAMWIVEEVAANKAMANPLTNPVPASKP
jgi:hypothetical protein